MSEHWVLPPSRLGDRPDWRYLLREIQALYRYGSAGGSDPIRSHMRTAREALSRVIKSDPVLANTQPDEKPVIRHLTRAIDRGRTHGLRAACDCVAHLRGELGWQHGYDRMPRALADRYAFAELAGPLAPVPAKDLIAGLVLFAPGCVYPAHAHDGITESYIVLSGAVSENHLGVFAPGSLIFNPPGHLHRITVSAEEPALLAYVWTGSEAALAGQKMVFSRPARRRG